jgi:DNA-binding transcriptional LysR family regulator
MSPTAAGLLLTERSRAAFGHLAAAARTIARGGPRGFAQPEQLMTATQLHAFLSLADAGSFLGAAQATGLSQPAIHRAVRDLEQLGAVPLVERRGRGVALTAAGRRLARGARLAAGEIAAAIAEARPERSGAERLTIGAMPLSRAQLVPAAIARLAREAPQVTIDVVEGSWRELVEPLRDGVIDLMIGALRDEPPPDLAQDPLMSAPLAVIGRAGHPLLAQVGGLSDYPWIVGRIGTPLRAQWAELFEGGTLPPAPIECGSVMVIREILIDGDFLTLLSPDQVALEIDSGVLAVIGAPLEHTRRDIGVTTRADWRPTEVQGRFVALLREQAG